MQEHPLEIITLEQFAKRLNISRSTAYNWLAEGRLVPGRHVVHIGRVIRVLWSSDLVAHLLALSVHEPVNDQTVPRRKGHGGGNRIAIDCDYLERN